MRKGINWKVLIACLGIMVLVSLLGSSFSTTGTKSDWFDSVRPSITPPNYVFPIAWTILYVLIGVSLYFAWISAKGKQKNKIALAFLVNLVANVLWSFLFFGMQNAFAAFIDIIIIWVSIIWMIMVCWKIDRKASYLLIQYFLWVSFASALNYLSI